MSYWSDRTLRNEAKSAKLAASYSARIKALHSKTYKTLSTYLDSLLLDIQSGAITTRSDLWRSKKYIELMNAIRSETGTMATTQEAYVEACLEKVYTTTLGAIGKDFGKTFDLTTEIMREKIINSEWLGSDFSARVWKNTTALAARLEKDMAEMLLTGKDVRRQLRHDLSVSYHEASRLVHTESAHIYTEASKEAYKQANVAEVEYLAEDDCCDQCEPYRHKVFALDNAPMLPIHPNCRCCLAPVIDLKNFNQNS